MTLAPVVRPYRRWRRRALVLAIVGILAGGYEYNEWLNSGHFWTYPEQNQRLLDDYALEAASWTLRHPGACPRIRDLLDHPEPPADQDIDMFGKPIEITCDAHDTVLLHSAGRDRVFRTPDDQISSRSPLTPIEPP